ncbi:related to SAP1 - member of the AAA-protein family [Cephalotrichum gorgonifer]|uniref:Related to SAP1 - member of the AAA-protein family n=1 Tax=Cephalotrichum gorgonifer TaxID=2041049 RepID=A0AAE8MXA2_9PEZI|nr:related to SAP1 - member of the AAA-protein family [Cephalotrichum gorgonifer]
MSAAARALKPAAASIPPGTNAHKAGSDRRVPSRSVVLPGADPSDATRKPRDPATRRGQRHIPEDQPSRKPATPRDNSPLSPGRTEALATAKGAQTDSRAPRHRRKETEPLVESQDNPTSKICTSTHSAPSPPTWGPRESEILANLPEGIDQAAARQILGELVVRGDKVHWDDIAGLDTTKNSLREAVVYPFLRPDLFIGLRQPACGILLFGPPGTGKTMLARAVATESRSTFFSLSASSLISKYLGDSEKLVRALFHIARMMAPSIIFVDEIDSLLGQRSGSSDHETTRRIKTEFLIQWSNLQQAVPSPDDPRGSGGDANRVLVLAATNLPWAIDEAARRRFVKRQYIPLPEPDTRGAQLLRLLSQQNHTLKGHDIERLVTLTEGYSGSDLAALAKDAAMGPLRSLGEALLHMPVDKIRPIELADFEASLASIRPSVSPTTLHEHENWAQKFGEWRK